MKARVFDDEISRDDFCFFAGFGAPYNGASFADVFRYDILRKVVERMTMLSRMLSRCGVNKKVWVARASAPKPLQHRGLDNDELPLEAHMVLEKLHHSLHLNTTQAEYCIRPLSEMPTPRQVYVAVIGIFYSNSTPPTPPMALTIHRCRRCWQMLPEPIPGPEDPHVPGQNSHLP